MPQDPTNDQHNHVLTTEDITQWITEDSCAHPQWDIQVGSKKDRLSYEGYFTILLRSRFMENETFFRTIIADYRHPDFADEVGWVLPTAKQIKCLLDLACKALKENNLNKQKLIYVSYLLNLVEECLVWIKPFDTIPSQILHLETILYESKIQSSLKERYNQHLKEIKNRYESIKEKDTLQEERDEFLNFSRFAFEEIIWLCNHAELNNMINIGLQISRLKKIRNFGFLFLIILFLITPLLTKTGFDEKFGFLPFKDILNSSTNTMNYSITNNGIANWDYLWALLANLWLFVNRIYIFYHNYYQMPIAIGLIGAVGGFISGLIKVKNSTTDLALYEESMLLMIIRPIFGAFASLLVLIFMSWDFLSALLSSNPGSLIFAAFLSGFSERYFLRLLRIEPEGEENVASNRYVKSFHEAAQQASPPKDDGNK